MTKEELEKRKKIIYDFVCDPAYFPMKAKEMAVVLSVSGEQRQELHEVLDALLAEGKLEMTSRGKYHKGKERLVTGVFTAHPRGFGFVTVEGEEEDIFIGESQTGGALHEDVVQVVWLPSHGKRREGRIVKIVEHGLTSLVGTFQKSTETFGFVCPDNPRIVMDVFVPVERSGGAAQGDKVVVDLLSYGERGKKPEGRIVEILGHAGEPGTDILALIKSMDLPTEFPERVENQALRVAKPVSEADCAGRQDLRQWQTVTIDGEDARDLDDAVTLTRVGKGYRLGVHIADVTNYVQERSALDVEALARGTSVYLVDRVLPMLPRTLSNGICSLNQGEDRLALSCIMDIDAGGNVVDYEIAETVICVDRRMTYTDVNRIITLRDEAAMAEYAELVPLFFLMKEVADLLRARRRSRGSIDFDFPETKVVLDGDGHPLEVKAYDRNPATKIIEDFMLAANETVAQAFYWQELPFLYRTHENPDTEKMRKLATFLGNLGFHFHVGTDQVHPKELQKLLEKIENTPQEALVSRLLLRSMKQAKYSPECVGHFGLAAPYYCHFTSPIRRYPDLQIHRIIKENLRGRLNEKRRQHYEEILPQVATETSRLERRADEAERESIKIKKVEYMTPRIGEIYEGVISGVTKFGLYVELENTIEGLIHITTLQDDYYQFIEERSELVGERRGRTYRLGQRVRIVVSGTNPLLRGIDFVLA